MLGNTLSLLDVYVGEHFLSLLGVYVGYICWRTFFKSIGYTCWVNPFICWVYMLDNIF
jgi:hypothetical protein